MPTQLTCEFPFVLTEIAECAVLEELSPQEVQEIADLCDEDAVKNVFGHTIPASSPALLAAEIVPPAIQEVLDAFADVFPSELPLGLPVSRTTDHRIELEVGSRPPAHRIYRMAPAEDLELKKQLDAYLKADQIEPAKSPFGAGVLFARKKDGAMRLCIDYRGLNAITVKDRYPLSRIDEMLDNMRRASFFTKLDLQQGFHQIRVHPDHVPRTAFQTKYGSFQFKVMPFGLCNATATFQRTMNQVLACHREYADVYIDDIIIHSRTLAEHVQHLRAILVDLRRESLFAKRKKCSFAQSETDFCGFIVGASGIRTQPQKLEAIRNWPVSQNPKDIRSFLGLCGFYQRFIPKYADTASPMTD